MAPVIVDSDVLIDVSRGDLAAISLVTNLESSGGIAISSITAMELIIGCSNKQELARVEKFLARFVLLHLTEQISEHAIDLLRTFKLSHGLLIADALIASTAIVSEMNLVTNNQRDFRFIEGLELRSATDSL